MAEMKDEMKDEKESPGDRAQVKDGSVCRRDNPYVADLNRDLWFQCYYGRRLLDRFGIPYTG